MQKIKNLLIFVSVLAIGLVSVSTAALAQLSSNVEFVIPDTVLKITGYASPSALVSIYDSNVLIGTTVAGSNGRYAKDFVGISAGLRNIKIEYIDQSGRKSKTISDTISVAYKKETAVDYYLPPTLEVVPNSVTQGGLVSFRGSSIPGSVVEIYVDGGNTVLRPTVAENGNYTIAFATDGFFIGKHPVTAVSILGNKKSLEAEKVSFDVLPNNENQIDNERDVDLRAPIITSPTSPASTNKVDNIIQGTAPPNTQIIIFIDGEPIGSTFSNSDGEWFFNISLENKRQEVTAIACIGSDCSDVSNTLVFEFTGDFGVCSNVSLRLNDYRFWGVNPSGGVSLEINQLLGTAPFEMVVDWGDGVSEKFNHADQDGFKLDHIYREVGQYNGQVTVQDSEGCEITRYFSVDVLDRQFRIIDLWWIIPLLLILIIIIAIRYRPPTDKDTIKSVIDGAKASQS